MLEVRKNLGGGAAGTADPNWPKGYFIPYDAISAYKLQGVGHGATTAA